MNLPRVEHQWICHVASVMNPYDNAGLGGLHPSLKTVTHVDISTNTISKLPVVLFQMPSLKVLNASENSLTCLPCLWLGGRRETPQKGSAANGKLYKSCENVLNDDPSVQEKDCDFTYAESGWNCPHLEEMDLHHNSLTSLPTCLFELPSLKTLIASSNDLQIVPFDMWTAPSLRTLELKENFLRTLPVVRFQRKGSKGRSSTLPRAKVLSQNKESAIFKLVFLLFLFYFFEILTSLSIFVDTKKVWLDYIYFTL